MLFGSQEINQDNHLVIGGCDTVRLADMFGTPLIVYDEEYIRSKCRAYNYEFKKRWPKVDISYACKAFMVKEMVNLVLQEGLSLDVASNGELSMALWSGALPKQITLHGNYKTDEELRIAVEKGVNLIVIDSLYEISQLERITNVLGRVQSVLIRLNVAVEPVTNEKYLTGSADSKFGISLYDGSALVAIERVLHSNKLRLEGVHFHVGSQNMDTTPYVEAIKRIGTFFEQNIFSNEWKPKKIVFGGGMGVKYQPEDHPPSQAVWAEDLVSAFKTYLAPVCASDVVIGIEPGRSIVAETGTTLYRVGPIKNVILPNGSTRCYVSIDGGLSDNPRPIMYGAKHGVLVASSAGSTPVHNVRISGRHCETDTLFTDILLPAIEPGAILAVQCTGAYTYCMSNNYNRFLRPAVVFVKNGVARLVARRETFEDLIRLEEDLDFSESFLFKVVR